MISDFTMTDTLYLQGEWLGGLYSARQVTDVKLSRVRPNSGWVTSLGGLTSQLTSPSIGRDDKLGVPSLSATCILVINQF